MLDKDYFLKKKGHLLVVDFSAWLSLSYSPILPLLLSKAQISVEANCLVRLPLLFPLTLHLRNSLMQGSFGISRVAKIAQSLFLQPLLQWEAQKCLRQEPVVRQCESPTDSLDATAPC